MTEPEDKMITIRNAWGSQDGRDAMRLKVLTELGLRQPETIPVFEEATQTAAHFLEAPISVLGFVDSDRHWFKSAVGLSRLGLMNQLAQTRQLLRQESFCTKVVENAQTLVVNDTYKFNDANLVNSKLVQEYGIRAYIGVPLFDASGNCLGSLAVMDLAPRNFTTRDIEFLQIIARWSMSEFERNRLLQGGDKAKKSLSSGWEASDLETTTNEVKLAAPKFKNEITTTGQLKLELLSQLTHELRTPLTSVLGMASVLGREIYGPLTTKQREYLEIIQHSGRYLLSLVNEISELGAMEEDTTELNLVPVDIEMLCQQAINTLEEAANRREQQIRLSLEPGRGRIWPLDKDKVRQILYHLIFSVIQISATGSVVRIHVSYKDDNLNITVWVTHPWLGEGITEIEPYLRLNSHPAVEYHSFGLADDKSFDSYFDNHEMSINGALNPLEKTRNYPNSLPSSFPLGTEMEKHMNQGKNSGHLSRESLGLLLSCQLAELHGGQIAIQGSAESGFRYLLSLPLQNSAESSEETSSETPYFQTESQEAW